MAVVTIQNQYEMELAQKAERIKQLEQQLKEATERNEHMTYQASTSSQHATCFLSITYHCL